MANAIPLPHNSLCVLVGGDGAQTAQRRSGGRLMEVLRRCGNAIRRQLPYRWMTNQPKGGLRVTLASAHLPGSQAALLRPGPGSRPTLSGLSV